MDDPHWAHIKIDATTGEVLYVEADLSGSSLVLALIAGVAIAVHFRKKRKEEAQP